MRFVHIGDSHLGLSQFNRLADDGVNLRERLIYTNFLDGIDAIVRVRPDAVVHAGDLFHSVRPKTLAYTTALEALTRLGDAGIPLLIIAGNHDMKKSRYTTSPFEVLEYHRAPIHAGYRYRYEPVDLGDARFHLIPNLLQPGQYREEFDRIEPLRTGRNVLVTHGLASTLRDHRLGTVMEHEIDTTMLSPEFDYIALGHFHGQKQVADNAWYCGSQEYISYAEIRDTKGGLLVDLDREMVSPLDLPSTPMIDLGELECEALSSREVGEVIAERAQRCIYIRSTGHGNHYAGRNEQADAQFHGSRPFAGRQIPSPGPEDCSQVRGIWHATHRSPESHRCQLHRPLRRIPEGPEPRRKGTSVHLRERVSGDPQGDGRRGRRG